jgi:hypothetical protein
MLNLESIDVQMQSRIDGFVNENPIGLPGIQEEGIQEDTDIKRIVNQMGSEDLCSRETDRTVPR